MKKSKKSLEVQQKDILSSNFAVQEKNIKKEISNIMNFSQLKKVTPRELYNEPFKDLFTSEQKMFLIDNWLIDCKLATKEEQKIIDWSWNEIDSWLEYSTFVSQNRYKIEPDIPLVSDGFSKCHAVVIYNSDTCDTMMLHVVNRDFELEHIYAIREFLSNNHWEAIFVYGSESRYLPEHDHDFLKKLWCSSKNIIVSTWPYHRWVIYDPRTNKIMIQRTISPVGKEMVTFGWFSDKIYDKEKRASYNIDNRMKELEQEVFRQILNDNQHYMLQWIVSSQQLDEMLSLLEKKIWRSINKEQFMNNLISGNKLIVKGDTFIFPSWFRFDNDNPYIRERYPEIKMEFSYKFRECSIANDFYNFFMVLLTKRWYKFIEWSRTNILLSDPEWRILIIENALDTTRFYFVWDWSEEQKEQIADIALQMVQQIIWWLLKFTSAHHGETYY